jgi:hypothetical protein
MSIKKAFSGSNINIFIYIKDDVVAFARATMLVLQKSICFGKTARTFVYEV